ALLVLALLGLADLVLRFGFVAEYRNLGRGHDRVDIVHDLGGVLFELLPEALQDLLLGDIALFSGQILDVREQCFARLLLHSFSPLPRSCTAEWFRSFHILTLSSSMAPMRSRASRLSAGSRARSPCRRDSSCLSTSYSRRRTSSSHALSASAGASDSAPTVASSAR